MDASVPPAPLGASRKKRKSGIPTGNAGEYLVMGELLRRGFDAQLADRNTKGYDVLAGLENAAMKRVQVKTVRLPPWFVRRNSFENSPDQITIYVWLGRETSERSPRFFIVRNRDVENAVHYPNGWAENGFLRLKAIENYENNWLLIREAS